ncbi:MAG: hypothetical protein ACLRZZ_28410 [Enterocloster sp.]
MDRRNIGWKKEQRQLCQKRYWSSRERDRRRGGLLDKIRSLLGGSQKKEEGPGVQTPAKDGKTAGETKEEGTDGKEASREKKAEKPIPRQSWPLKLKKP